MFTAEERARLRTRLLEAAAAEGIDNLPQEVTARFEAGLITRLNVRELARAFKVVLHGLFVEIEAADHALFTRLKAPLTSLIDDVQFELHL